MPDLTHVLDVQGWTAPGLEHALDVARADLASGAEVGLSVCAVHDGEMIVDIWGGLADVTSGTPWVRDTIVNTFSITKTMVALCALLLVDAGELDLDAPVARYWPQFAAAGKQDVLVRHLLSHTSGVAGWQQPVTIADICDVERATEMLAAQQPWWTAGDGSGYHTLTQGHLVGAVIQRITGRSLGAFFAETVTGPLGADFHIGTPASCDERIARLVAPPPGNVDYSLIPADSIMGKALLNPAVPVSQIETPTWRRAELGAANGHGNARSVASIQAVVSGAGPSGPVTLKGSTLERIFDVQADGLDRVLGMPLRFGIGYGLPHATSVPEIPTGRVCWWTGYGGSLVVNDLDRRLTVAYVMNKMGSALVGLGRAGRYVRAVYAALDGAQG
ncbi:MAG TPA: serine hydrolase domain-containing protein [Jatrophihabitantaceae bacterium]|nr:serine hydrolase domain-containing protein [Jatrophihabitantaceae bacterium]